MFLSLVFGHECPPPTQRWSFSILSTCAAVDPSWHSRGLLSHVQVGVFEPGALVFLGRVGEGES